MRLADDHVAATPRGGRGMMEAGTAASGYGRYKAVLLLEVCVALAIMVAALGVLGAQLASGLQLIGEADQRTRAVALVDRLLTLLEFNPEWQELVTQEEELEGDFGEQHRGWFWEIEFKPLVTGYETEEEGPQLGQVVVRVLYQEDRELREQKNSSGARLMRQVALLKAARGTIDLVGDFGMSEDQVASLTELLPTLELDPSALDPQVLMMLATEDPEVLLNLLPALIPLLQQYFGEALAASGGKLQGPGELEERMREELDKLSGGAEDFTGEDELDPFDLEPQIEQPPSGSTAGGRRGGSGRRDQSSSGDQPRYTIEDLMRLRDEMQRQGGG